MQPVVVVEGPGTSNQGFGPRDPWLPAWFFVSLRGRLSCLLFVFQEALRRMTLPKRCNSSRVSCVMLLQKDYFIEF